MLKCPGGGIVVKKVSVEEVLDFINKFDMFGLDIEQMDVSLQDYGMDSIVFIQIILGLEDHFDCEIPDSKLLISEMDTLRKIVNILQELYNNWEIEEEAIPCDKI